MLSLDSTKQTILESNYKLVSWLFDVDPDGSPEYWSTKNYSYDGHDYSFKVIANSFQGIKLSRSKTELNIYSPISFSFEVSNPDNTKSASTYVGKKILLKRVIKDDADPPNEDIIGQWKLRVKRCEQKQQKLKFTLEDFVQEKLRGDYPVTRLIKELSPSDDPDIDDSMCVPVPFGTCYIPLRSLLSGSTRYYLLGPTAGGLTYNIEEVRTPRGVPGTSIWTDAIYDHDSTQTTVTFDSTSYRVFSPIVIDTDGDNVVDDTPFWKNGDHYYDFPTKFSRSDTASLTNPADVIEFVLKDMGVEAADIDSSGSFATFKSLCTTRGISFNGAFYYKQSRTKVLAQLLNMCNGILRITDKIELHAFEGATQETITSASMLRTGEFGPSTFDYSLLQPSENDSGYIAFQESGVPQDAFVKAIVSADSTKDSPSGEVLTIPFIQDDQLVQIAGKCYYQKKLNRFANPTFKTKLGTSGEYCAALQPEDIIAVNDANYGGSYTMLVDSVFMHKEGFCEFNCTRYSPVLDDWDDVSTPGAITIASDSTTTTYTPVYSGPDSDLTGDSIPNLIRGRLRMGTGGAYIILDPAEPIITFTEDNQERFKLGDLGTDDWGIEISDHSGNSIMKLDGSGTNTLSGWGLAADKLEKNNARLDSSGYVAFGSTIPSSYGNNIGAWLGYSGGAKMSLYSDASNYLKWDGSKLLVKGTNFELDASGNIIATGGSIGGWTISTDNLSAGSGTTKIKFKTDEGIWLGADALSNAPFSVTKAGVLTAESGTIASWTISANTLAAGDITLDAANNKITIDTIVLDGANTRIRSSNYSSGLIGSGFTLEPDLLEVANIRARGMIRTAVFQKDVISAVGGNVLICPADVLASDMTSSDSAHVIIEGEETFSVGDILRIKEGTDDEWLSITNKSGNDYTVTRDLAGQYGANNNPAWSKGATVVNYRQSGDGGVYLSSSEGDAPHIVVFTHTGSPYSSITQRVRIGNLNGFLDYSSDLYGIGIGETDSYLKYDPTNGLRIKGDVIITGGSGYLPDDTVLGDIPDGNGYGKIGLTYISGGQLILETGANDLANVGLAVGENLVINGNFAMGSLYNLDYGSYKEYDSTDGYVGAGCLKSIGGRATFGTFYDTQARIPINKNELYEISCAYKIDDNSGTAYLGFTCCDADGDSVGVSPCWRRAACDTTLYEAITSSSATTCKIVPPHRDWVDSTSSYIQFDIKDDYTDLPRKGATKQIQSIDKTHDPTYWELTLATSVGDTYPVDTKVGNSLTGGSYNYILQRGTTSSLEEDKWHLLKAYFTGLHPPTSPSYKQPYNFFRHGTTQIMFQGYLDYDQAGTITSKLDDITIRRVTGGCPEEILPPSDTTLKLYLAFDDGWGTDTAVDGSQFGLDASLGGTITWVDGVSGSALQFNGTDTYASVANDTSLNPSNQNFSLSFWMKPDLGSLGSGSYMTLFKKLQTNAGWEVRLYNHATYGYCLRVRLGDGTNDCYNYVIDANNSGGITDGEWHHVVVVWSNDYASIDVYINGSYFACVTKNSAGTVYVYDVGTVTCTTDLYIGQPGGATNWYKGILDEIRLYMAKILEPTEVYGLYKLPGGHKSAMPVPYPFTDWRHSSDTTYIDGGKIYTNSITLARMSDENSIQEALASQNNLLVNPGAEFGTDDNWYSGNDGSHSIETSGGNGSDYWFKLVRGSTPYYLRQSDAAQTTYRWYEVNPGDVIEFGGDCKSDGTAYANIQCYTYKADKSTNVDQKTTGGTYSTSWVAKSQRFTVGADAKFMFLRLQCGGGSSGNWAGFDNVYLRRIDSLSASWVSSGADTFDGTNIEAGSITLVSAASDFNMDAISDTGTTYGKVKSTSISAGKIVVAGLDSDVTARMFQSSSYKTNIEGWAHASDVTLIDGGDIYANSITLHGIADENGLQENLSTGRNLLANGGFELSDTTLMYWQTGTGRTLYTSGGNGSNNYLRLTRSGTDKGSFQYTADGNTRYFEVVEGEIYEFGCDVKTDGTAYSKMRVGAADKDKSHVEFAVADIINPTSWTHIQGRYCIPSGIKFLRLELVTTNADGYADFDNCYLRKVDALQFFPADNDLVGYWPLDDGSGDSAIDASGNGNEGTLYNSPTWTDGIFGKCLDFDGSTQYVDCGASSDFDFTTEDFSISVWINAPTQSTSGRILSRCQYQSNGWECFLNTVGRLNFRTYESATSYTTYSYPTSASVDHHVVFVRDGTSVTIYVDGIDQTESAGTHGDPVTSSQHLTIGKRSEANDLYFDGKIDDVRVYDKALSYEEVRALYEYPMGVRRTFIAGPQIPQWSHSSDTTYIDGGKIYTGSIVADSIAANTITLTKMSDEKSISDSLSAQNNLLINPGAEFGTDEGWWSSSNGSHSVELTGGNESDCWFKLVRGTKSYYLYLANSTSTGYRYIPVNEGEIYEFGADVKTDGVSYGRVQVIPYDKDFTNLGIVNTNSTTSTTWEALNKTYIAVPSTCKWLLFRLHCGSGASSNWAGFDNCYLRKVDALQFFPADNDLAGYWPLDDGSGDKVIDASGNGNEGTLYNSPTWTDGVFGTCLDFDGSTQYGLVPHDSSLNPGTGDWSVSFWVNQGTGGSTEHWICRKYGGSNHQWGVSIYPTDGTNEVYIYFGDGTNWAYGSPGSTSLTKGTWNHVAVVWDRSDGTGTVYVNGLYVGDNDISSVGDVSPTGDMYIAHYGSAYLDGKIDNLRVYDKALSYEEVRALYEYPMGVRRTVIAGPQIPQWYHPDNTTYIDGGKIFTNSITVTSIANNAVTLDKLASSATDLMFTDADAKAAIEGWRKSGYPTLIDGDSIFAQSITAGKINVTKLSDITGDTGTITAGSLTGVTITGSVLQTATSGKRIYISSDGIELRYAGSSGQYGDFKYGAGKYGSGAIAYIHHSISSVPFYIDAEQTVADIHLYNRTTNPSGSAEVGDLCVVNGVLKIYTSSGWVVVGSQS